ncbi:multiubiquitin domain-containing protein [Sphingomonas sp. IC-56]|uniref:multiubiquitin domain-containing protein n=1 Tax=Sphingomonas sp. IC-56 TaxID=2898529 RepID=UPI001E46D2D3|nr:multiubiquitin domain-containing protein [Sphingomonas sp. IC-56]MCD2323061.1 multiubiquitin domain-containing protein [Sphingomonas sp. IC-56]
MNHQDNTIIVDGLPVQIESRSIDTVDVLAAAGLPSGTVIRIDGGHAAHFAPIGKVTLEETPTFRTFRGTKLYHLRVNGVSWDWGGPAIIEEEIRSILGVGEDHEVRSQPGQAPMRPGSVLDLTGPWPPQVEVERAAPVTHMVPININGRPVVLDRPEVTFEDLVGKAFPGTSLESAGSRSLTVTYRRGPPERPEGSLIAREAIRLTGGEVFSVTATDKS